MNALDKLPLVEAEARSILKFDLRLCLDDDFEVKKEMLNQTEDHSIIAAYADIVIDNIVILYIAQPEFLKTYV